MKHCIFTRIDYQSPRYQDELRLRYQVLRQPLGLTLDDIQTAEEARAHHFGMMDGTRLIACVLALPTRQQTAVIRQMAVAKGYRSRGIGAQMLAQAESELLQLGITALSLSARTSVIPFYRRAGYTTFGEEYLWVTLPHRWMRKNLTRIPGDHQPAGARSAPADGN